MVFRKALDVPGCLVEFGSQWGASVNASLLLKQIYEPWNAGLRILSFSTFGEGFLGADEQDGSAVDVGDCAVTEYGELQLTTVLGSHATSSPIGAEANYEVFTGDACKTFPAYLEKHPELIISHIHFDMDAYAPTRDLLAACIPRMPKGAVLVFDEPNCPSSPGETIGLQETLGLSNLSLRKSQYQPYSSYAVMGG